MAECDAIAMMGGRGAWAEADEAAPGGRRDRTDTGEARAGKEREKKQQQQRGKSQSASHWSRSSLIHIDDNAA